MHARFEIPFWLLRAFSRMILSLGFAFEVRGYEHIRHLRGGVILAGNHTGLLDTPMVLAAFHRPFRFLMREEVFGWGVIGKIVPYCNIIPLYKGREKRALADIIARLQAEQAVCIFPEGRLSENGDLGEFNEGVAFLYEKARAPIVPFAIHGGFEAWREGQLFPTSRKVVLEFGPPIPPPEARVDRRELTRQLKQTVKSMLQRSA